MFWRNCGAVSEHSTCSKLFGAKKGIWCPSSDSAGERNAKKETILMRCILNYTGQKREVPARMGCGRARNRARDGSERIGAE